MLYTPIRDQELLDMMGLSIEDEDIKKILGPELKGDGAKRRIREFRENFVTSLEDKLEQAERAEQIEFEAPVKEVMDYITGVVDTTMKQMLDDAVLRTPYLYTVESRGTTQGETVKLEIKIEVYTGQTTQRGQIISDHKTIDRDVLRRAKTININGFRPEEALYLTLKGHPEVYSVTEPVKHEKWGIRLPSHKVTATYHIQMTMNQLKLVYSHLQELKTAQTAVHNS